MGEQPVIPAAPAAFSWLTELVTRVPSHSLLALLFIYFLLVRDPEREAAFLQQDTEQRTGFATVLKSAQERADEQLSTARARCNEAILNATKMGDVNRQLIEENQELVKGLYSLIEKTCTRSP